MLQEAIESLEKERSALIVADAHSRTKMSAEIRSACTQTTNVPRADSFRLLSGDEIPSQQREECSHGGSFDLSGTLTAVGRQFGWFASASADSPESAGSRLGTFR